MSSSTAPTDASNMSAILSNAQFDALTREVLAAIEARADAWLQADVVDIDAQRTGGLLELSFPNGSKIIVNTQPPLRELWLAAKSAGRHFRYDAGCWVDTRDSTEFFAALSTHASEQAQRPLKF